MGISRGPKIVSSGLVLCLDAANKVSYPGSGTVWTDLSGNNNTGTLTNGPTFSAGNQGSIVFDGTNDYISTTLQTLNRPFTLSVWANFSNLTGFQTFVGQDTSVSIPRGRFYFQKAGSTGGGPVQDKVNFSLVKSDDSLVIVNTINTVSINVWYNFTVTLSTSSISLYQNGVIQSTTADSNSLLADNTVILLAAGYYSNNITDFINGKMASVFIYNRELTATEILQNYNATKGRFGR